VAAALGDVVAVLVAVLLSPGPVVPPAGPVAPLAGDEPPGEPAGVALGLTDLADGAVAVEEVLGGHAVGAPLTGPAEVPPWPAPLPVAPIRVPVPAALGASPLPVEEDEIPTAEPSSIMAPRSGGTARTKPMANAAQAMARAGRNVPYRHDRGRGWPGPGSSAPPRAAFRRPTRPARKPLTAAAALASLLA
jgi:hypothetical protein